MGNYKVTNRLMRRLETLYNISENPPKELILQKNPKSFKNDWKIIVPSSIVFDKNDEKYSKRQSMKQFDE